MMSKGPIRTLAIDPSRRGFGFAVLEGSERLLDWGVAQLWSREDSEFLTRLDALVSRYEPKLLVLEDTLHTRRWPKAIRRIRKAEEYAASRTLQVIHISRDQVQSTFEKSGVTKLEIAVAIARIFPELEQRLPRRRKPWMTEDERMDIFDATSFALAVLWSLEWSGDLVA